MNYIEYMEASSFRKPVLEAIEQSLIDINRIVIEESLSDAFSTSIIMEASNPSQPNQNNEKGGFLHGIIFQIQKIINAFLDMFKNIFGGKENLTPEQYLQNPQTQIRVSADISSLQKDIDGHVAKGTKLAHSISAKTGLDQNMIQSYVDEGNKLLKKYGPVLVKGTFAFACAKFFQSKAKKWNNDVTNAALGDERKDVTGNKGELNSIATKEKTTMSEKIDKAKNQSFKKNISDIYNSITSVIAKGIDVQSEYIDKLYTQAKIEFKNKK